MNPPSITLEDLVVVVTGAGGGIGAGIAGRLVAVGASVVAQTRTSPVEVAGTIEVRADLNHPDGPQTVIDGAITAFGRVDALVNNAGIQPVVSMADMTDDGWRQMIETNLTSAHRLTKLVADHLVSRGASGSIVHIASIEGSQPAPLHAHYATSKAGLIMHARAAALAYGRQGIRVNSVSPGLIDRPGLAHDWPEGVRRWLDAAPLGRLGTPEDIGDACVFLLSPMATFISGIDLIVDGGVLTRPTW